MSKLFNLLQKFLRKSLIVLAFCLVPSLLFAQMVSVWDVPVLSQPSSEQGIYAAIRDGDALANGELSVSEVLAYQESESGVLGVSMAYNSAYTAVGPIGSRWTLAPLGRVVLRRNSLGEIIGASRYYDLSLVDLIPHSTEPDLLETAVGKPRFLKGRVFGSGVSQIFIVRHTTGDEEKYEYVDQRVDAQTGETETLFVLRFLKRAGAPDGKYTEYKYNAVNYDLEEIEGSDGKKITLVYNTQRQLTNVVPTHGRTVTLVYDTAGELQEVDRGQTLAWDGSTHTLNIFNTALQNQILAFDYNSTSGLLEKVTYPAGEEETFEYYTSGNNVYRLKSKTSVLGMKASYFYNSLVGTPDSSQKNTAALEQLRVPDLGASTYYHFNAAGDPLLVQVVEETDSTTVPATGGLATFVGGLVTLPAASNHYNVDGMIDEKVNPLGDSVEYVYDVLNSNRLQQGNIVQIRRIADTVRGGDGNGSTVADLVVSHEFEGLFNARTKLVDASGSEWKYYPSYFEGAQSAVVALLAGRWQLGPVAQWVQKDLNMNGAIDAISNRIVAIEKPNKTDYDLVTYNGQGPVPTKQVVHAAVLTRYDADGRAVDATSPLIQYTNDIGYSSATSPEGAKVVSIKQGVDKTSGLPSGEVAFQYDSDGRISQANLADGTVVTNTYTDAGMLKKEVNGTLSTDSFYDLNNRLVRVEKKKGYWEQVVIFRHNDAGQLLEREEYISIDPTTGLRLGRSVKFQYDVAGRLAKEISAGAVNASPGKPHANDVIEYEYDSFGRLLHVKNKVGSPLERVSTSSYDDNGNLIAIDNAGSVETYLYDGFNRRVETVYPNGSIQTLEYDPMSRIVHEELSGSDGHGGTMVFSDVDYQYNSWNELVSKAFGSTVEYYQNDTDNGREVVVSMDGGVFKKKDSFLGSDGRVSHVSFNNGIAVDQSWDGAGRVDQSDVTYTEPGVGLVNSSSFVSYDTYGFLQSDMDSLGRGAQVQSRPNGASEWTMDSNQNVTTFTTDPSGAEIKQNVYMSATGAGNGTVPPNNTIVQYVKGTTYDEAGKIDKQTKPLGNYRDYSYGTTGMVSSLRDYDGSTMSIGYQYQNGNLTSTVTKPSGVQIISLTNSSGKLVQVSTAGASTNMTVVFTRDGLDRVTEIQKTEGANTIFNRYWYNSDGFLTREQIELNSNIVSDFSIAYTDRVPSAITNLLSGEVVQYTKDQLGRVVSKMVQNLFSFDIDYVANLAKKETLTLSGGAILERDLGLGDEAMLENVTIENLTSSTVLLNEDYHYDKKHLLAKVDQLADSGVVYEFDSRGATTKWKEYASAASALAEVTQYISTRQAGAGGSPTYLEQYSYNANGYRSSSLKGAVSETYTINTGDRIVKVNISGTNYSYVYNADGLLTSRLSPLGTLSLEYDAMDRVVALEINVSGNVTRQEIVRDAIGRPIKRESFLNSQSQSTESTQYLNDKPWVVSQTDNQGTRVQKLYYNHEGEIALVHDSVHGVIVPLIGLNGTVKGLADMSGTVLESVAYAGGFGEFSRQLVGGTSFLPWNYYLSGIRYFDQFALYEGEDGQFYDPALGRALN